MICLTERTNKSRQTWQQHINTKFSRIICCEYHEGIILSQVSVKAYIEWTKRKRSTVGSYDHVTPIHPGDNIGYPLMTFVSNWHHDFVSNSQTVSLKQCGSAHAAFRGVHGRKCLIQESTQKQWGRELYYDNFKHLCSWIIFHIGGHSLKWISYSYWNTKYSCTNDRRRV